MPVQGGASRDNQVKDMDNRKEIADNMVQQFKDESIQFDYDKFYKAIGC